MVANRPILILAFLFTCILSKLETSPRNVNKKRKCKIETRLFKRQYRKIDLTKSEKAWTRCFCVLHYRVRVGVFSGILRVDPFKYFEGSFRFAAFEEKFRALRECKQPQAQHYRGQSAQRYEEIPWFKVEHVRDVHEVHRYDQPCYHWINEEKEWRLNYKAN